MFAGLNRSVPVGLLAVLLILLLAGCRSPVASPVSDVDSPVTNSSATISANELPDSPSELQPPREAADNMAEGLLVWDAVFKEYRARPGETVAPFTFNLTNVSPEAITIYTTETSCDCTVAQMPSSPWQIPPGSKGAIAANIDLRQKRGVVTNYVVVLTSKGNRLLTLKTVTPRTGTNSTTSAGVPL